MTCVLELKLWTAWLYQAELVTWR